MGVPFPSFFFCRIFLTFPGGESSGNDCALPVNLLPHLAALIKAHSRYETTSFPLFIFPCKCSHRSAVARLNCLKSHITSSAYSLLFDEMYPVFRLNYFRRRNKESNYNRKIHSIEVPRLFSPPVSHFCSFFRTFFPFFVSVEHNKKRRADQKLRRRSSLIDHSSECSNCPLVLTRSSTVSFPSPLSIGIFNTCLLRS